MLYKSKKIARLLVTALLLALPGQAESPRWKPPPPALAALSDHPEKVERVGGLFFGGLTELRPLIFQYYHLGLLHGKAPNLTLFLHNPGNGAAIVHLRKGYGPPSLDYFSTGHGNNVNWFKAVEKNEGEFISIAAGATVPIFRQAMPVDHVVSGTLGMTLVEGAPVQFALVAQRDDVQKLSLNNLLKHDDVHSRGFYPVATQYAERTFEVGQPPMNLVVGAVRQQTFSGVRELRGDYGVTYDAKLTLVNPTDKEATVRFFFNPRGGTATGTFLLDGRLIELGQTDAFAKKLFHQESISPNSSKLVDFATIPEGASSYPVRIVLE